MLRSELFTYGSTTSVRRNEIDREEWPHSSLFLNDR